MKDQKSESGNSLADALDALKLIAQELKIEVHISAKPLPVPAEAPTEVDHVASRREALLWVQEKMKQDPFLARSLEGNYIGVYQKDIIAKSPSYEFARLCAKRAVGEDKMKEVIFVPVRVADQDASDIWRNLLTELQVSETT
jgi:hypothetical protein